MSKTNQALVKAHRCGWRVSDEGQLLRPDGSPASYHWDKWGYPRFSFYDPQDRSRRSVHVHRLAAYEKFGDAVFECDMQVRHADGNPANTRSDNILIGSPHDNAMDKPRVVRIRMAAGAARKLDSKEHGQLMADRASGMSYRQLVAKYGLTKSTISYIVRGITYSVPGVDV